MTCCRSLHMNYMYLTASKSFVPYVCVSNELKEKNMLNYFPGEESMQRN